MKMLAFFFGGVLAATVLYFAGIGFARKTGQEAGRSAAEEFTKTLRGSPEDEQARIAETERETERLEAQMKDLQKEFDQKAAEKRKAPGDNRPYYR